MSPHISDFIPEIVCLGVDCFVCSVLYATYKITDRIATSVKEAPVLNLDSAEDLKETLVKHSEAVTNQDGETYLPYAILRGDVLPLSKSLKSLQHDDEASAAVGDQYLGVIRQFEIVEHKRSLSRGGFWYDSSRTIHDHSSHVPFCLVGTTRTSSIFDGKATLNSVKELVNNHVEVTDWQNASRLDTDVTKDVFDPSPGGLGAYVWGWIIGDRPKGVRATESMLLNGTTLTGVGELVLSKDNSLKLQAPSNGNSYYLVKDTPKELILDFERTSKVLKYTLMFFGGAGLAIISIGLFRYYRKRQQAQRVSENRDRLEQIIRDRPSSEHHPARSSVSISGEEPPATPSCVICLAEQREVIILDCGHVCVCAGCAIEVMRINSQCPVCRSPIARVAPAYIA